MRILLVFILSLGSLFDCWLLMAFAEYGLLDKFVFLAIHFSLIAVLLIYYRCIAKETIKIPFYMALFLPGLGLVFVAMIYILLAFFRKKDDFIESYEKYIQYVTQYVLEKDIDFKKELNISPALDSLSIASNREKKNVIIDLISDDIDLKVHILKKALKDEDPEVVHYASSTLNLIENEYERKIETLKGNYISKNSEKDLKELLDVYDQYIHSGLNHGKLLKLKIKDYINIIDEYIEKFGEDYDVSVKKMEALITAKELSSAFKILNVLQKKYPHKHENYIYTLKILFYMRNYREVRNIVKTMKELAIEVPEEYASVVKYWS